MARPRDPDIDQRILAATAALLAEGGYDAVSVAAVAERAEVSRPAVYRRWPSRAHLVFEMATNSGVPDPLPDTGTLRGDLRIAVEAMAAGMAAGPRQPISEQIAQMILDPTFAREVVEHRLDLDRDLVLTLWDRGVTRGEVRADVDGRAVLDAIVGACLYRILLRHEPPDRAFIDGLIDRSLHACAPAP